VHRKFGKIVMARSGDKHAEKKNKIKAPTDLLVALILLGRPRGTFLKPACMI